MRRARGKTLGGEGPRRRRGVSRRDGRSSGRMGLLGTLAIGLFVLGLVGGFAWAADRQLRGGVLRQRAEAQRRPDWVALDRLPAYVPAAFVAVVDPAFLETGTLRAGEEGTTLARELVRQVHLIPGSLGGEARELVMAPLLEHRTDKRELLELFLNRVYLGREQGYPVFGIHHAAREYFDKEPSQLSLGETATLAGLLLAPRIEDPDLRAGAVGARRNEVLRVMWLGELITAEQYRQAASEPLAFQPGLDEFPMTRPADWGREAVIRLPENLRPQPDSVPADSTA